MVPLNQRSFTSCFLLMAVVVSLGACSKKEAPYVERSVSDLYNDAMDAMVRNRFRDATQVFDEVERQHPYSPWAAKAMLMSAYANFQIREYDKSVSSLESFIQLHPGHEDVSYAYYLIALNYYDQISTIDHDQKMTEQSQKSLDSLIRRFPNSAYARDARLKMSLVRDHLAGKNLDIGRYYLRTGATLAAMNRFRKVVEKFHDTSAVEEALYRLVECYLIFGMLDQVLAAAGTLGHNYPGSEWYSEAYSLVMKHAPHLIVQPTGS